MSPEVEKGGKDESLTVKRRYFGVVQEPMTMRAMQMTEKETKVENGREIQ